MGRHLSLLIRRASLLALLLATGLSMVCGLAALSAAAAGSGGGLSAEPKPAELRVAMYVSSHYQGIEKVIGRFTQKTGIKVVFETSPQGEPYYKKVSSSLLAGQATPDVLFFNDGMLSEFAGSGWLEPLDQFLANKELADPTYDINDFLPVLLQAGRLAGPDGKRQLYGLPNEVSSFYLWYRTDLITNPPQTWDEYLEVAKKFTQSVNPNSPTKYGTVLEGAANTAVKEWLMWLWSFGGDLFDQQLKVTFNSPQAKKSLAANFDLLLKYKVVPPGVIKYGHPDITNALKTSLVPMALKWTSGYRDITDPTKSPVGNKLAVSLVPGVRQANGPIKRVPFVQQWMWGVNANSKYKKHAFKFVEHWTSKEGLKAWGPETGGVTPGRKSILNDKTYFAENPYYPLHAETLALARGVPNNFKEWSQVHDAILGPALNEAVAGQKPYDQALDEAARSTEKLLRDAGYYK